MVVLLALASASTFAADNTVVAPQPTANLQSPIHNLKSPEAITIPQMLSYQGKLTDTLGQPVQDTTYSVTFRLYTEPSGGSAFWNETQAVRTKSGLFSILLGSVTPIGSAPDAGALYLGMAVAGGTELVPRLRIASAAYAYKADTANFALAGAGGGDNAWVRVGSDSVLYTTRELGIARGEAGNKLYGNQAFTHVNLGVACTTGTSDQNSMCSTVGGGGRNIASHTYATVAGGMENVASNPAAAVGGGYADTASGAYATVGGGNQNSASGLEATVGGGAGNTASNTAATVGGGYGNTAGGFYATIGGGYGDTMWAYYGGVLSGKHNLAGDAGGDSGAVVAGGGYNRATGMWSFVGGGGSNDAAANQTTVGGGFGNQASAVGATVAGGAANDALGIRAFVGGGSDNSAGDSVVDTCATVTGGYGNAATHMFATVGGGQNDTASHARATVAGGGSNLASGDGATVAGGWNNTASGIEAMVGGGQNNTATAMCAVVGGGNANSAAGTHATVGGGYSNAAPGDYAFVGGGYNNTADTLYAMVGGGYNNDATGYAATVGGGYGNTAETTYATVSGGYINEATGSYATVGGGNSNDATGVYAVVGGGQGSSAAGGYSAVPGGYFCAASGNRSFAAGSCAKARGVGSFVWSDSCTSGDSVRTASANRWVARARGGVYFYTNLGMTTGSYLDAGGSSWNSVSDSMTKENFRPVDKKALLDALARMRVRDYNLKSQDPSIRHIGPVAQDFHNAFGFGESNTAINMEDADGVLLAAVQALFEQNQAQQAEIEVLTAELKRR
jgi:hypothetical protein